MASDLRTYLNNLNGELLRIEREVDPLTELGALCLEPNDHMIMII